MRTLEMASVTTRPITIATISSISEKPDIAGRVWRGGFMAAAG